MSEKTITPNDVSYILDSLYDCEALIKQLDDHQVMEGPTVVASYKDLEGNVSYAIECDMHVAASLGAALTRIPAGAAKEAAAKGEIPENIGENLYEVLNICSTLFADFDGNRILLDKVIYPGQADPEIEEKLKGQACLMQMNYELERYQEGKISFLKLS